MTGLGGRRGQIGGRKRAHERDRFGQLVAMCRSVANHAEMEWLETSVCLSGFRSGGSG